MASIQELPGLGPKSEASLAKVGILNEADLRAVGPVMAFYRLKVRAAACDEPSPSLNFLYALVGGVSGRTWLEVAQNDRERLLNELDSMEQMERVFR